MLQPRTMIALVLAAGSTLTAMAQETAPIRSVIAALNKARRNADPKSFSRLFAPDGSLRVGNEIIATGPEAIENAFKNPQVWSETTAPIIGKESIHFVSPEVALVDATQTQYGSLILKQSVPVTLLLKLDAGEWRIVSLWLHPIAGYSPLIRSRAFAQ